jgi:hypothetical protein
MRQKRYLQDAVAEFQAAGARERLSALPAARAQYHKSNVDPIALEML